MILDSIGVHRLCKPRISNAIEVDQSPDGKALRTVEEVIAWLHEPEARDLDTDVTGFSDEVKQAILDEFADGNIPMIDPVSWEHLNKFYQSPVGQECCRVWGFDREIKLGQIEARVARLADRLSEEDFAELKHWFQHLEP